MNGTNRLLRHLFQHFVSCPLSTSSHIEGAALVAKLKWKHDQELPLIHDSCLASMQKNRQDSGDFKEGCCPNWDPVIILFPTWFKTVLLQGNTNVYKCKRPRVSIDCTINGCCFSWVHPECRCHSKGIIQFIVLYKETWREQNVIFKIRINGREGIFLGCPVRGQIDSTFGKSFPTVGLLICLYRGWWREFYRDGGF